MMIWRVLCGAVALMMCLSDSVMAREYGPPAKGAVCARDLAAYVERSNAGKSLVARLGAIVARDDKLYFHVHSTLRDSLPELKKLYLVDLTSLTGKPDALGQLETWFTERGGWAVAVPEGSGYRVQVLVDADGVCKPVYRGKGVRLSVLSIPHALLD